MWEYHWKFFDLIVISRKKILLLFKTSILPQYTYFICRINYINFAENVIKRSQSETNFRLKLFDGGKRYFAQLDIFDPWFRRSVHCNLFDSRYVHDKSGISLAAFIKILHNVNSVAD